MPASEPFFPGPVSASSAEARAEATCKLAKTWAVDPRVLQRAMKVAARFEAETGRKMYIISGFRTVASQIALKQAGRPAADPRLSNHTSCPATAVDVTIGFQPTKILKATMGRIAVEEGLRWGGGSPVGSDGIPSDWNHFDVGPRKNV